MPLINLLKLAPLSLGLFIAQARQRWKAIRPKALPRHNPSLVINKGTNMTIKKVVCICLPLLWHLLTGQVQAAECFHVALPPGVSEYNVPRTLDFLQTAQGDMANGPGFSLYHSGENLALLTF
jgi:hypothetical protein